MINYIANVIKNRVKKKNQQPFSEQVNSQFGGTGNSPTSRTNQYDKPMMMNSNSKKTPSSLLWVFKINFNGQQEEMINRNRSINNFDQVVNEDGSNAVVTKITSIKLNRLENPNAIPGGLNNNYKIIPAEVNKGLISSSTYRRERSTKGIRSNELGALNMGGNKTSHERYRKNINKHEGSIERLAKIDENPKELKFKIEEKPSPSDRKAEIYLKKSINLKEREKLNPLKLSKDIKKPEKALSNSPFEKEKKLTDEKSPDEADLKTLQKLKKNKKKRKKNKKKKEEVASESEILTRIKQNLMNLFEKQRQNNRVDCKLMT